MTLTLRNLLSAAPLAVAMLLAACSAGSAKPPAPPSATIQKLAVGADGTLALELRVQNYGKKAVHFVTFDAELRLDGADAGAIHAPIGFDIPPRNSEIVATKVTVAAAIRDKLLGSAGADARHEVRYAMKGTIVTDKPDVRYPFEYASALSPVPGVPNEYR